MKDNEKYLDTFKFYIIIALICYLPLVIVLNYFDSRRHSYQPKRECIEIMGTIHNATRMYYIENARTSDGNNITVDELIKRKYLIEYPICPSAKGLSKENAYYKIIHKTGQKFDIECVNIDNPNNAHGSYLKLTNQVQ